MKNSARAWTALVLLILIAAAGCQTGGMRFNNWWNYYARGLVRMEARDYVGASEDFERCLDLRPGARFGEPREAWRVRTYGVHILQNYFPHRELGVCLHLLGRPVEAEPFLRKSLQQLPSDRARYFLGAVRGAQAATAPAPTLAFAEAGPLYSRNPVVEFAVTAHALAGLAEASIDGNRLPVEPGIASQSLRQSLRLPIGRKAVAVTARDEAGREVNAQRTVVVDPFAPSVVENARRHNPDGSWTLDFTAHDGEALHRIEWNGRSLKEVAEDGLKEVPFRLDLPARAEGRLIVRDRAGNELELQPGLALAAAPGWRNHQETAAVAGAAAIADAPPDLRLNGPADLTVFDEQCVLDGELHVSAGLRSLTVEGREWPVPAVAGDARIHFAGFAPVRPGAQQLRLQVTDLKGRVIVRMVNVNRREPQYTQPQYRLAAVIPPVWNEQLLPPSVQPQSLLVQALVGRVDPDKDRFQVLARGQDFLRVLEEQRLNLSDLVDEDARIAWPRLQDADLFFNGQILTNHLGSTLRMLIFDANSPDRPLLGSEDVYLPDGARDLPLRVRGLASKLERRFPIHRGRLSTEPGRSVAVTLEEPCAANRRFLVIRPGADGALESGAVLIVGNDPVEWVAEAARGGKQTGKITPEPGKKFVRPDDWVYTR